MPDRTSRSIESFDSNRIREENEAIVRRFSATRTPTKSFIIPNFFTAVEFQHIRKESHVLDIVRGLAGVAEGVDSNPSFFPLSSVRLAGLSYYSEASGTESRDASFIGYLKGQPFCCAVRVATEKRISFFDQPFRVEFAADGHPVEPNARAMEFLATEIVRCKVAESTMDLEIPVGKEGTNPLIEKLLPRALKHAHYTEVSVDLSQSTVDTFARVRKSHRQSIRAGTELLGDVVTYFGDIDDSVFEKYRELHRRAAGRDTRNSGSWDEQKQAIKDNRASLTTVTFESEIIGATFSWVSASTGLYVSGAYDRSKFSTLPVSHVSIWRSVEHAQSLGVTKFIVGEAYAPGGTDKERSIAQFKRGFSTQREHFHRITLGEP